MVHLRTLVLVLLTLPVFAQSTQLTVQSTGCKALYLYQFNGSGFDTEADLVAEANGQFTLQVDYDETKFRYLGAKPSDALPLIIKPGESIKVTGNCGKMRSAKVSDSRVNAEYKNLKRSFQTMNGQFTTATRAYQAAQKKGETAEADKQLGAIRAVDAQKVALLTRLKTDQPLLGRIATLNTYQSFLTSNNDRFKNELDYFVNTYFQYVDFQDEGYNDLPWTYEGNRNFANTLSNAVRGPELAGVLSQVYKQWPDNSRAQLFAMSGGFASLAKSKHPAAVKVADEIVAKFKDSHPAAVQQIKLQADGLRTFSIGAVAPTFAGETPEGDNLELESLRGKVVLIDFWASWCGPCRRENPNVVKVYDQYKDKGFEILAVSLDSKRDRWVKAIADDKLTWLHISDLKGWKSSVARQYGVSSIPQTVLLDAEGRILARNLRGAALEQKLAEVFAGK